MTLPNGMNAYVATPLYTSALAYLNKITRRGLADYTPQFSRAVAIYVEAADVDLSFDY